MQNVIYAVIGVILTVAAMYMVSPSISASSEAIQAGMISTEVGAIKNAGKMWVANSSADGKYSAITVGSAPGDNFGLSLKALWMAYYFAESSSKDTNYTPLEISC